MKSFSFSTRLYLFIVYIAGSALLIHHFGDLSFGNPWLFVVLCLLASLALILKVEGAANRSYYTFSLVVYGFTLIALGAEETILVVILSNIVEWAWHRNRWPVQLFNIGTYLVAAELAGMVFLFVNQSSSFFPWGNTIAILLGMTAFAVLHSMMSGMFHWLTHNGRIQKSGILETFPIVLDISLLYFGACLSIVWKYNPFAIILFIIPTYFLYRALRIPALERKTELDSKTGLFNHAYFKKQLDAELNRSNRFNRPLSVIIADLDLLRNINNTYGHLAGDEVLIGVATAMKQSVREYDVVSRFGGEEFAILLPETTLMQAYEKAEFFRKMIEKLEFIVPTSKTPIRATMSFGVAHREDPRQTSNEIVHNADLALYNSKLSGRNKTFAHANNACFDIPTVPREKRGGSSGIDLNTPSMYLLGTYMNPPVE